MSQFCSNPLCNKPDSMTKRARGRGAGAQASLEIVARAARSSTCACRPSARTRNAATAPSGRGSLPNSGRFITSLYWTSGANQMLLKICTESFQSQYHSSLFTLNSPRSAGRPFSPTLRDQSATHPRSLSSPRCGPPPGRIRGRMRSGSSGLQPLSLARKPDSAPVGLPADRHLPPPQRRRGHAPASPLH